MIITVNGSDTDVPDDLTVEAFVVSRAGSTRGSAVVVDGEVVPRSTWTHRQIVAGCDVEVVTAVQGG